MHISASELHLRRAKDIIDPRAAIDEYMKAIQEAVREMRNIRPRAHQTRRR